MQVQRIQNNNNYNTAFQSTLKNSKLLRGAFTFAKFDSKPTFVNAVNKLLNDGKTDVIDIATKHRGGSHTYYQMDLKVNGTVVDSVKHDGITDGQAIQKAIDAKDLLIRYAGLENSVLADRPASYIEKKVNALEKKVFG